MMQLSDPGSNDVRPCLIRCISLSILELQYSLYAHIDKMGSVNVYANRDMHRDRQFAYSHN